MRWLRDRRCPHANLRGIYGDEILHTPGYRRLHCVDCGMALDGPVALAIAPTTTETGHHERSRRITTHAHRAHDRHEPEGDL